MPINWDEFEVVDEASQEDVSKPKIDWSEFEEVKPFEGLVQPSYDIPKSIERARAGRVGPAVFGKSEFDYEYKPGTELANLLEQPVIPKIQIPGIGYTQPLPKVAFPGMEEPEPLIPFAGKEPLPSATIPPMESPADEGLFKPLLNIMPENPAFASAVVQKFSDPQMSPEDKLKRIQRIEGVSDSVRNSVNFFVSPVGVAMLGLGGAPKIVQQIAAAGFALDMGSKVPGILGELGTELGKPENERDQRKIGDLVATGITTTGFSALAGAHGVAPAIKGTVPFVGGTRAGFVTRPDVEALRVTLPEGQREFVPSDFQRVQGAEITRGYPTLREIDAMAKRGGEAVPAKGEPVPGAVLATQPTPGMREIKPEEQKDPVTVFDEEASSATGPLSNEITKKAGLSITKVSDFDRLAELKKQYEKEFNDAKERYMGLPQDQKTIKELEALTRLASRYQYAREVIETATNTGSWVEGGLTNLGERPLDWRKNSEAADWLRKNGEKVGIEIPDELKLKEAPKAEAPAEATVRVYHGEGGAEGAGLGGFSVSKDPVYAARFGPRQSFVDVPASEFERMQKEARSKGTPTDLVLSEEYQKKLQPVEKPTEMPVEDLDKEISTAAEVPPPAKPPEAAVPPTAPPEPSPKPQLVTPEVTEKPLSVDSLKREMGLTEEQAIATEALVDAMGLDKTKIDVTKGGVPAEDALKQAEDIISGKVVPPEFPFKKAPSLGTKWLQNWTKLKRIISKPLSKISDSEFVKALVEHSIVELAAWDKVKGKYRGFYDEDIPNRVNNSLQKFAQARYGRKLEDWEVKLFHLLSTFASPQANPLVDSQVGLKLFDKYIKSGVLTDRGDKQATIWKTNAKGERYDTGEPAFNADGTPKMVQASRTYAADSFNEFQALVNKLGGVKQAIEWMTTRHTGPEIEAVIGKRIIKSGGGRSPHEYLSKENGGFGVFGITGPKLGSYFLNRVGEFSTVTKDMWYARTMARLFGMPLRQGGKPIKDPWLSTTEKEVRYRKLADQAWEEVARRLGTSPAVIQQRVWDIEKRIYAKLGMRDDAAGIYDGVLKGASDLDPSLTPERIGTPDVLQSTKGQVETSAKTSRKQVPSLFKSKLFEPSGDNLDIGAGKFDLGTQHLKSRGVESTPYDPFNRDPEANKAVVDQIESGKKFGTVTVANVLNVIDSAAARENTILQAAKAVKPGGKAYFQIYEGDGTGIGKTTKDGWQNNRKTGEYVEDISKHFNNVKKSGNIITASDPKPNLPKAEWKTQVEGVHKLFQKGKASVEFVEGGKALIRALNNPDASSAIHEIAHTARRFLLDRGVAPENRMGITDDHIAAAEKWAGVKEGKWTVKNEEKFARGFERYLRDGQAPSVSLGEVFLKFKQWLTSIYSRIRGSAIEVKISPAMREVYDALTTRRERLETGKTAAELRNQLVQPELPVSPVAAQAPPIPAPAMRQGPGAMTRREVSSRQEPPEQIEGTGLKNAIAEMERVSYGFGERSLPEKQAMAEAWQRAGRTLQDNPEAGRELAQALIDNPRRGLTGDESALILRHKVALENAINNAAERSLTGTGEVKVEAQAALDRHRAELSGLIDAVERRGTEWGREGRWRQALAYEDYSFATQERLLTASKGRPLTDAERTTLQQQLADYREKLANLEKHNKERDQKLIDSAVKEAIDKIEKQGTRVQYAPRVIEVAENFAKYMDGKAEAARARLAKKLGRASMQVDPTILSDVIIIGTAKLARGAVNFAKWSDAMIKDLGPGVKEYLKAAWAEVGKTLDSELSSLEKTIGKPAVEKVRQVVKKTVKEVKPATPEEKVAALVEKTAAKFEDNELSAISPLVRQLARHFVANGVRGRDAVIDAVHSALEDVIPGISRSETMRMIAGYGEYKLLPQDTVSVLLRGYKGEMQQIAKLEDMASGSAPQKTGIERRTPTDEERRLIKEVEEAKKRGGYTVTDPATQLRTAMDAVKTRLQNQITDLERQIATREKIIKEPTRLEYDEEANRLKARRDELKKEFDEIFPKEPITEAERLQRWKTRTQNRIDELNEMLRTGDIEAPQKRAAVQLDAEGNRLQSILEEAKENIKHARDQAEWERMSVFQKFKRGVVDTYDAARMLMTTGEFSFILRQGKWTFLSRPLLTIRALPKMFQAMRGWRQAHEADLAIFNHPDYAAAKAAKLHLVNESASLSKMEEIFAGRWAHAIPVVSHFNRAARVFLNKIRFDTWQAMRKSLARNGVPTPAEDAQIAMFVNESTGRGSLGFAEQAAIPLGRLFFAPRYVVSRFQLLTGHSLWKGNARTRRIIATEYARALIGLGIYYSLLNAYFANSKEKKPVTLDPRSSDFGKVRIGNTRIDPLAGLSQAATFIGRTATGETKTQKGRIIAIRKVEGKKPRYGDPTWSDVAARFARSKMHPIPGAVANLFEGTSMDGAETTISKETGNLMGPITYFDIYRALSEQDIPDATAMSLLALLGEGLQTYNTKK